MRLESFTFAMICIGLSATSIRAAGPNNLITSDIRAAADKGEPDACFEMARACLSGKGAPKDPRRAFQLMKTAADQGHADALGGLGYFYVKGLGGVAKDPAEALRWFRLGAEKGSAKSMLNLGLTLLDDAPTDGDLTSAERDGKIKEGLEWIRKAADLRLSEAALSLGGFYYTGEHGLPVDYNEATRYLKISAEQQNPDAQNILGAISENGLGCPVDEAAAIEWYRKAAIQGSVRAQSNLGRAMGPESKDRQRRIEALAWLQIAADLGNVMAQKSLDDAKSGTESGDLDDARTMARELRRKVQSAHR